MKKLIVLDFTSGEVHVYSFRENKKESEEILMENDHQVSNCEWMVTEDINLIIH